MGDLDRLKVLISHWIEHNREHAQTYREWAEKTEAISRRDIATILHEISSETERMNDLFEKVRGLLQD